MPDIITEAVSAAVAADTEVSSSVTHTVTTAASVAACAQADVKAVTSKASRLWPWIAGGAIACLFFLFAAYEVL
jgi:hypothetical protein